MIREQKRGFPQALFFHFCGYAIMKRSSVLLVNKQLMKPKNLLVAGVLFLTPFLAFADTADTRANMQEKSQELRQNVQKKRQELKADVKIKLEAVRKEAQEKRMKLLDESKKKREEFKEKAQTRREELKKKMGEKRAENIEKYFLKMIEKFESAVDRLEKFADRIEARLNKEEDNGKNVTALKDKLAKAREKITAASSAIAGAKARYEEAIKDPDFKIAFKKVKEAVASLAKTVREAHAALVDVVNSIKGLGVDESAAPTATSQ